MKRRLMQLGWCLVAGMLGYLVFMVARLAGLVLSGGWILQ